MMVVLLLCTCLGVYAVARRCFGRSSGLLALLVAGLSPTLLAHGRLVSTDLPIALAVLMVLYTYANYLARPRWVHLLAAGVALGAASVTKFSWPIVLPVILAMGAHHAWRSTRTGSGLNPRARPALRRAWHVVGRVLVSWPALALITWACIWTAYGWQRTVLPAAPSDATAERRAALDAAGERLAREWDAAMHDPATGQARGGILNAALDFAVDESLLPDAYVFGIAQTRHSTTARRAYLLGAYSDTGWLGYFPLAFLIKTPISSLLLIGGGIAALCLRRVAVRDPVLLLGMVSFVLLYAVHAVLSGINIGHRHLLPLYPLLFVIAGAASAWAASRVGRWLVGAAIAWLAAANIWIHPHYLSYFNELVGGPRQAHHYLVDSNLDWGQDLLRLADYAAGHSHEEIKLAYFGSAIPTAYLTCTALPSFFAWGPRAELTAGTYVVSATQLMGVYHPEIRDDFWHAEARAAYAQMLAMAASPAPVSLPAGGEVSRDALLKELATLRVNRLMSRLKHRAPDERIGWSLFVFHLDDNAIAELTQP
jgi:hypothetical protein